MTVRQFSLVAMAGFCVFASSAALASGVGGVGDIPSGIGRPVDTGITVIEPFLEKPILVVDTSGADAGTGKPLVASEGDVKAEPSPPIRTLGGMTTASLSSPPLSGPIDLSNRANHLGRLQQVLDNANRLGQMQTLQDRIKQLRMR